MTTAGKPLELVHYPPLPPEPVPGTPEWVNWEKWRAWDELKRDEFRQRRAKRLTDAELAAEYWREGDAMAPVNYDRDVNAEPIARILHRFAASPDYLEAEYLAVTSGVSSVGVE